MLDRIRAHLTYANVASSIALFIALAGGTAWAGDEWTGANIQDGTLTSADYKNNDIRSGDVKNFSLGNGDFLTGSVDGRVATDNSLTGADIQDQSGVDTCISTTRIGSLCVRGENQGRPWDQALAHCGNLDLRVPTVGEALQLARTHDIPNVDQGEFFWADNAFLSSGAFWAYIVNDLGEVSVQTQTSNSETVCVMTPTN